MQSKSERLKQAKLTETRNLFHQTTFDLAPTIKFECLKCNQDTQDATSMESSTSVSSQTRTLEQIVLVSALELHKKTRRRLVEGSVVHRRGAEESRGADGGAARLLAGLRSPRLLPLPVPRVQNVRHRYCARAVARIGCNIPPIATNDQYRGDKCGNTRTWDCVIFFAGESWMRCVIHETKFKQNDSALVKNAITREMLNLKHPSSVNTSMRLNLPRLRDTKVTSAAKTSSNDFWDPSFTVARPFLTRSTCSVCDKHPEMNQFVPTTHPDLRGIFGRGSSCAIVTGASELTNYSFGKQIDSHPVVLRLNLRESGPKTSYGNRTTHMMVNEAFWNKGDYRVYNKLHLLRNRTDFVILNHFILDLEHPQMHKNHPVYKKIIQLYQHRKEHLNRTFVLSGEFTRDTYRAFEIGTKRKVRNTPSTGFVGCVLLAKVCKSVHGFGFTDPPNTRWHDVQREHELLRRWSKNKSAAVKLTLYP